ncbi:MAG TPA: PAS domain S-box protein [Vicinamibacterales bacterium]|nr:PAS domain S-box protein [Vicinamibacterales bacterium]
MTDPTFLPPLDVYRSLVADAAEGITIVDPRGTILFENHAAVRLFGWETGIGRRLFDTIHATALTRMRQTINDVVGTPALRKQVTVRLRHRDGRWLMVRATCHRIDPADAPLAAVHWIDISDYDLLETRLRHVQKLLTLGRMISTVADDLDAALGTIRLHLVALIESRLDELRRFRLESILRATSAASVVASTLRGYARTAPIVADRIDVNDLLHAIRLQLENEGWLVTTLSAGRNSVLVDRRCLQDALIDLVRAFHHALPPDTIVTMTSRTPPSGLPGTREGTHVVIEVGHSQASNARDTESFEPWGVKAATGAIMLAIATLEDAVGYFSGSVEVTSTRPAPSAVRVWLPIEPTAENPTSEEPTSA